jgi:hypothetical protein
MLEALRDRLLDGEPLSRPQPQLVARHRDLVITVNPLTDGKPAHA